MTLTKCCWNIPTSATGECLGDLASGRVTAIWYTALMHCKVCGHRSECDRAAAVILPGEMIHSRIEHSTRPILQTDFARSYTYRPAHTSPTGRLLCLRLSTTWALPLSSFFQGLLLVALICIMLCFLLFMARVTYQVLSRPFDSMFNGPSTASQLQTLSPTQSRSSSRDQNHWFFRSGVRRDLQLQAVSLIQPWERLMTLYH